MKEDLTRKRNIDLSQKLDDLKFELQYQEYFNGESTKRAKELVDELEVLRNDFLETINSLKEKQRKYDELLEQITLIKETMKKKNK